mmetsp:Transcript_4285/g.11722  ORF Transcript_4285/g.11722 Transcript_4285/m.11722 type:complete len:104 (-) Transcript_4285:567-878(-)
MDQRKVHASFRTQHMSTPKKKKETHSLARRNCRMSTFRVSLVRRTRLDLCGKVIIASRYAAKRMAPLGGERRRPSELHQSQVRFWSWVLLDVSVVSHGTASLN